MSTMPSPTFNSNHPTNDHTTITTATTTNRTTIMSTPSGSVQGLDHLPHHLLSEMYTNIGVSVAELSKKHVVLLVFLRYFGCVFCQRNIVDIVNSLSSLIKFNCLPVFVHQESEEEANAFFSEEGMPHPLKTADYEEATEASYQQRSSAGSVQEKEEHHNNTTPLKASHTRGELMKKFLRVADPEGNYYYQQFGVKTSAASDIPATLKTTIETFRIAITQGYKIGSNISERASRTQLAATFVIAQGKIVNQFLNATAYQVPDVLEILLDLEGKSSDNVFDLMSLSQESDSEISKISIKEGENDGFTSCQEISTNNSLVSNIKELEMNFPTAKNIVAEWTNTTQSTNDSKKNKNNNKRSRNKESSSCLCFSPSRNSNTTLTMDPTKLLTLEQVLVNNDYRKVFKLFAAKLYAVESLLFWEHATRYQKTQNDKTRVKLARMILDTYLDSNSPLEINTSSTMKQLVLNRYEKEGSVIHLFDELIRNMEADSIMDTYLRFLESDLCKEKILNKL
ncbi:hypothetical protein C9374_009195 [Naegleria lovaniensis]|uniref:RGS domain-containing protein n=1 Tax=Naegleria lovaniensis TaxID=51637 RepID=A0AA88GE40_NAELO|nr:uncharacterized protein C9374_009195 [Naegleria lovaniensis]KAG2377679.1 hypothetical protein C9374_009195 [Naegleria lovaniensis]